MNANYKCTVSVRIPTSDNDVYRSELRSVSRVPVVGEYVRISAREHWYKIVLVVHNAFDDAECSAEVYTEPKGLLAHDVQRSLLSR
jgi:hypothetical protein